MCACACVAGYNRQYSCCTRLPAFLQLSPLVLTDLQQQILRPSVLMAATQTLHCLSGAAKSRPGQAPQLTERTRVLHANISQTQQRCREGFMSGRSSSLWPQLILVEISSFCHSELLRTQLNLKQGSGMHFGNQGATLSWQFLKNKENKGIEYSGSINSKQKH